MRLLLLFCASTLVEASAVSAPQSTRGTPDAVFEAAAKEPDIEGAGLVLSSLLSDESTIRSAFLSSVVPDERSLYVLFGSLWFTIACQRCLLLGGSGRARPGEPSCSGSRIRRLTRIVALSALTACARRPSPSWVNVYEPVESPGSPRWSQPASSF